MLEFVFFFRITKKNYTFHMRIPNLFHFYLMLRTDVICGCANRVLAARSVHLMCFLLRPGWREVVDWA